MDEERKEEQGETEETLKDLEISDDQGEDVKGGLGGRERPEDQLQK